MAYPQHLERETLRERTKAREANRVIDNRRGGDSNPRYGFDTVRRFSKPFPADSPGLASSDETKTYGDAGDTENQARSAYESSSIEFTARINADSDRPTGPESNVLRIVVEALAQLSETAREAVARHVAAIAQMSTERRAALLILTLP